MTSLVTSRHATVGDTECPRRRPELGLETRLLAFTIYFDGAFGLRRLVSVRRVLRILIPGLPRGHDGSQGSSWCRERAERAIEWRWCRCEHMDDSGPVEFDAGGLLTRDSQCRREILLISSPRAAEGFINDSTRIGSAGWGGQDRSDVEVRRRYHDERRNHA
jgi:hypothetical protein